MQVNSTVNDFFGVLSHVVLDVFKLLVANLEIGLFAEGLIPQHSALVEQRGVESAVLLELGVLVICRVHD